MFEDSMSTSHPIIKSVNSAAEIAELFDSIETTKSTAILRMADYYMGQTVGIQNNTLSNIVVREMI
jgi:aminopeptidase N